MKNLVRIAFLALALVMTGMTTLSADDDTLSCGIPCSTFNGGECYYVYDPGTDTCIPNSWPCPWISCA